jgi:hypothetical protein
MATRVEKVFKTNTLKLTNQILNEISDFLEKYSVKKNANKLILMHQNIAHEIHNFYQKNGITDEDINYAMTK